LSRGRSSISPPPALLPTPTALPKLAAAAPKDDVGAALAEEGVAWCGEARPEARRA
jgi:hypothetical protein